LILGVGFVPPAASETVISGASQSARTTRGGGILAVLREFLELDHIVEFGTHRDVGNPLEDDLDDDQHSEVRHQLLRLLECGQDLLRLEDAERPTAEPFATVT
jgi:hypothetical protein